MNVYVQHITMSENVPATGSDCKNYFMKLKGHNSSWFVVVIALQVCNLQNIERRLFQP